MLAYLILSGILSTVGALIYILLLRRQLSATQSKFALLLIVLLSLATPFFVPELPNYTQMLSEGKVFYDNYTEWNVVDINDKALIDCYNKADDSKDMCDCEVIQKANIVTFQYDPFYNFMVEYGKPLVYGTAIISSIFLLVFFIKIFFLFYLIKKSYSIEQHYNGMKYYLLYPNLRYELPLSAFSLFHNYVIWSPILDKLDEKEREAVLLHEITHLKHRDTWILMLLEFSKAIWWMLPAYYFLIKETKRIHEFVADEAAGRKLGDFRKYARLLLRFKEQQINKKSAHILSAMTGSLLKRRVLHLLNSSKKSRLQPIYFITQLILISGILWVTAFVSLPELQKQELKVKQYEVLQTNYSKTGESVFCKSCLQ
jgi:beta-lactamase regulating signal transducer with metallopeptidase domain